MEELLNKLIEKGWKPFGDKDIAEIHKDYGTERFYFEYEHYPVSSEYFYLRHLTSKESGLWQFCVENNLLSREDDSIYNLWIIQYVEDNHQTPFTYATVIWWLIESALCDEDKLEEFLLDNIKVS